MKSKDYFPFEAVSPYSTVNEKRLSNPKEGFKQGLNSIKSYFEKREVGTRKVKMLDVGCANGEFMHFISNHINDINLTGLDMCQSFLNAAEKLNLKNSEFINSDIFKYSPKHLQEYDIVTCFGTIPIFKDCNDILCSLFNLLKPGGILIVIR